MNKYEKLIDLIINEDEEKARDLFHEIVVEKSKSIYESLMDDEIAEEIKDDEVRDLADDVEADEEGVNEEDDDDMDMEMDMDSEAGDDMGVDDMDIDDEPAGDDEEPATKGDVMDLESAIDELKAEFDKIMDTVDADDDGDHDMDDHEEAEADMEEESFEPQLELEATESDEEAVSEETVEEEEAVEEAKDDSNDEDAVEEAVEEVAEADEEAEEVIEDDDGQAELDKLREYVEKVAGVSNTEGADNKSSVVAGKNDMGGDASNIATGGDEAGGKVAAPKVDDADNVNSVPGKAGKLDAAPKPKTE